MKQRIFVGSASGIFESNVIDLIDDVFGTEFDVWRWEAAFPTGDITYQALLRVKAIADFGIFVITPVDLRMKNRTDKPHPIPRDNVIFELGLLAAGIGPKRVFSISLKTDELGYCVMPTDLAGVTELRADVSNPALLETQLRPKLESLKSQLQRYTVLSERENRISVGLAIGYYQNFVRPMMEALTNGRNFNVVLPDRVATSQDEVTQLIRESIKNRQFCLRVVIPGREQLVDAEKMKQLKEELDLVPFQVEAQKRSYPFGCVLSRLENRIVFVDIPTTLITAYNSLRANPTLQNDNEAIARIFQHESAIFGEYLKSALLSDRQHYEWVKHVEIDIMDDA